MGGYVIETGMCIYGMNACVAALLVNLGCGDRRYFRWPGVTLAAVGAALAIYLIWRLRPMGPRETLPRTAATGAICSSAFRTTQICVKYRFAFSLLSRVSQARLRVAWRDKLQVLSPSGPGSHTPFVETSLTIVSFV